MKLVFRQSAAAVVVTLALLVGACGKEKESPRRAAEKPQVTEDGERRNQSSAQGSPQTSAPPPSPQRQESVGTTTPQTTAASQLPITEDQRRQIESMLQALRNNQPAVNTNNPSSGFLSGIDPKLATALLQCPGALLGGSQNLDVVSIVMGLIGGQGMPGLFGNTQNGQQLQASTQPPLSGQVVDAASCVLKSIL